MYAKLNNEGNQVIVMMTKTINAETIHYNGRSRKIYEHTTETVTKWSLGSQPDHYQIGVMGQDAERIMAWAREQDEAIKKAFVRNAQQKLAGGRPVIVGTKSHKDIKDKEFEGFISDAKTGEFCGVIVGARSIAGFIPEPYVEPVEVVEEKEQETETTLLPSLISDQLHQAANGLLEAISNKLDTEEGITRAEAYQIYEAERQIYYTLTRGLGIKANEYETNARKQADRRFGELKKGKFGMALRQAADSLKQE